MLRHPKRIPPLKPRPTYKAPFIPDDDNESAEDRGSKKQTYGLRRDSLASISVWELWREKSESGKNEIKNLNIVWNSLLSNARILYAVFKYRSHRKIGSRIMMDVNVRNSSYMYASPDNCDLHIENSASEGEGYCLIKTLNKEITWTWFFFKLRIPTKWRDRSKLIKKALPNMVLFRR